MIKSNYMRTFVIGVVVVVVASVFFLKEGDNQTDFVDFTDKNTIEVVLTKDGYNSSHFIIKKGTEVTFKTDRDKQHWPASNIHPSHNIYSEFDSKRPLESDETWSFIFDRVGLWGFHDHIRSYYVGEIKVIE